MTGMSPFLSISSILCIGLIFAASLHDIATRTIPNGLVLALAAAGLATAALDGHLFGALLAAGVIFVASALCWRRGWMGGSAQLLLAYPPIQLSYSLPPLPSPAVCLPYFIWLPDALCPPPLPRAQPACSLAPYGRNAGA